MARRRGIEHDEEHARPVLGGRGSRAEPRPGTEDEHERGGRRERARAADPAEERPRGEPDEPGRDEHVARGVAAGEQQAHRQEAERRAEEQACEPCEAGAEQRDGERGRQAERVEQERQRQILEARRLGERRDRARDEPERSHERRRQREHSIGGVRHADSRCAGCHAR